MKTHSLFTEFLQALGVRHTTGYSDEMFNTMTFKSLFGFSELLDSYGIPNAAWKIPADSVASVKPPFVAQTKEGFVVVKHFDGSGFDFTINGVANHKSVNDFEKDFCGVILTAQPNKTSIEPEYSKHRILDFARSGLNCVMIVTFVGVLAYLYITRGFYHNAAQTVLLAVDLAGLAITGMLMLKSVNVHLKVADNVCGILQEGGCDKILSLNASKFFGLFGWSEVGFGYFIVSTAALLLFPSYIHYLALANLCCLPFTCWSIWYQKFRAKHWCTLCVITQTLLWCQFVCYLCGGFERHFDLCRWEPWILVGCYVFTVLILNKIAELLNGK